MADDPKRHKKSKKKHRKESKHGRDIPMEKMPKKVRCAGAMRLLTLFVGDEGLACRFRLGLVRSTG